MRWTQENVWRETLSGWKWISATIASNEYDLDVYDLKSLWLSVVHPELEKAIQNNCLFCEMVVRAGDSPSPNPSTCASKWDNCKACPGRSGDTAFCCESEDIDWYKDPGGFYEYLLKTNRKRLKKKRLKKKR